MEYTYTPQGVCSMQMVFEIDNEIIKSLKKSIQFGLLNIIVQIHIVVSMICGSILHLVK